MSKFLIVCFVLILTCAESYTKPYNKGYTDFDHLLFAQSWPITGCIEWRNQSIKNYCSLPRNPYSFNIHGLWPTMSGTEGPNFCKNKPKFSPATIAPLMKKMEAHWANIRGGTDSYQFWSHEWKKHGTCALPLPQFNSVFNYFNGTLNLNSKYKVEDILAESGIKPRPRSYKIDDILDAIVKKLKKSPQIYCTFNSKKEAMLSEIRFCFDRSVKLIDCSSVGVNPKNCRGQKNIIYPKNV